MSHIAFLLFYYIGALYRLLTDYRSSTRQFYSLTDLFSAVFGEAGFLPGITLLKHQYDVQVGSRLDFINRFAPRQTEAKI